MTMDQIDKLLRQPLPEQPDHGFSAKVMARIAAEERRNDLLLLVAGGITALLVFAFLPFDALTAVFAPAVRAVLNLPAVTTAVAVTVLSLLFVRQSVRS
jgi:hypothetical protein